MCNCRCYALLVITLSLEFQLVRYIPRQACIRVHINGQSRSLIRDRYLNRNAQNSRGDLYVFFSFSLYLENETAAEKTHQRRERSLARPFSPSLFSLLSHFAPREQTLETRNATMRRNKGNEQKSYVGRCSLRRS